MLEEFLWVWKVEAFWMSEYPLIALPLRQTDGNAILISY